MKKIFTAVLAAGVTASLTLPAFAMEMSGDAMMKKDAMMGSSSSAMMEHTGSWAPKEMMMMRKEMRMKKMKMRMEDKMMKKDTMPKAIDGMMKKDVMPKAMDGMMKKDTMDKGAMMQHSGMYKDMTASNLSDSVLNDGQTKVLFFHAAWCPVCKTANATLTSWFGGENSMLSVYKLNYDNETALKQKYGVVSQHTFVKIDGKGNLIKIVTGPADAVLKDLLKA